MKDGINCQLAVPGESLSSHICLAALLQHWNYKSGTVSEKREGLKLPLEVIYFTFVLPLHMSDTKMYLFTPPTDSSLLTPL